MDVPESLKLGVKICVYICIDSGRRAVAVISFSEWCLSTGKSWGCGFWSLLKQSFDSVGLRGGPGCRALVSLLGFRLPGDSHAQSVLGTIEVELYLSNLSELEVSVGPESMILIQ